MHLDHIRIGLEAGCTIFSEKPIVVSIEESLELARLLNKHGHERLLVGLVLRYSPLYRDLRAAQAEGKLGDVVSIEASEIFLPTMAPFSCATGGVTSTIQARSCWKNAATISISITAWSVRGRVSSRASVAARASRRLMRPRMTASTTWKSTIASRAAGWDPTRYSTAMAISLITRRRSSNMKMVHRWPSTPISTFPTISAASA